MRRAPRPRGQHFLSPRLAAELVAAARLGRNEVVVEIGAGGGRLTKQIAERVGEVIAVELDPRLARRLRSRCAAAGNVTVVHGDILAMEWPRRPFRAFGNVPFAITSRLLRRLLDDPRSPLVRADLVVQWEVAAEVAARRRSNLRALTWSPWWRLELARRIPSRCFHPPPVVDAAVLRARRRSPPLLPAAERDDFVRFLVRAWCHEPSGRLRPSLQPLIGPRAFKCLARDLGFERDARVMDLDVGRWVALYERTARLP